MSYTYVAYLSINDTDGRSKNFSQTPTVTVWNGLTKAAIASPSPTLTDITTGLYAVEIELAIKTDVLFKIVPHVDDQDDIADIKVIHEGYIETVGELAKPGDAMTLISAYDKAKDDVLTPLGVVDGLIDILIDRLTADRAGYLDNLNIGVNTIAHTGNASDFKADVSGLAEKNDIPDISGLVEKTDLASLAEKKDLPVDYAKEITLLEVKEQTDQMVFTLPGKVDANATVNIDGSGLAKQETSEEILAKFASTPVQVISNYTNGKITAIRGDDWLLEIPCELPDSAKYQVALKRNKSIEDSRSTLFVSSDKGLVILNGEPHATSADASLAYNNVTQTLTLIVKSSVTMQLEPADYRYGIQTIKDNVVKELYQGSFVVTADVVRAIE